MSISRHGPKGLACSASTIALASLVLIATPAAAQQAPRASADNTDAATGGAGDIVVTATRVVRDGYKAPTPTTVVGEALLVQKAPSNVVDALATLPAFKGSGTTGTAGPTVASNGGQGFANLRGLGANRTLVMLNSQRVVPSTEIGTVDLNLLPTGLIQRVDVVTGGASASYGSDAVSGVVNFVLATKFQGLKAEASAGISSRGDDGNQKLSLTAGRAFMDDHLHLVASAEYFHSDGLEPLSRPWAVNGWNIVSDPAATAANGLTQRYLLPYSYFGSATARGLINAGPLKGTEFLGNGQTQQFQYCNYVASSAMACAGPRPELSKVDDSAYLATPIDRVSAYGRATYDISNDISVYVDYLYGRSSTGFQSAAPNTVFNGNLTIQRDNAYLPDAIRAKMVSLNLANFSFGRVGNDIGASFVNRRNVVNRITAGFEGKIAGFKVSLYGQHGVSTNHIAVTNNTILANWRNAVDAVVNPANGQIVCRSTLTNPTNGCVPANMFGENQFNPALRGYVLGTSEANLRLEQNSAALDISGEPFSIWAGPVSLAAGFDYREDKADQTVTALDLASAFATGNFKPLAGRVTVKEAYAEVVVPLIKNSPFTKSLELNAAGRITDYSTSGTVETWKVGLSWEVVDGVRFRGTRSRDIRAANILELYSSTVQTSATISDPQTKSTVSFQTVATGNPNLRPERADTWAAGVVLQPVFLPGFSASVDYYDINISDSIQTNAPLDIVTLCYNGVTALCSLVQRDSNGAITLVTRPYLNLAKVTNAGVDIEASYRTSLDGIFGRDSGEISLRALGNRIIHNILNDGFTNIDRAGSIIDGTPKWTWDFGAEYHRKGLRLSTDITYLGGGKYDNRYTTDVQLADNHIPSVVYVNLNAEYSIPSGGGKFTIFANVNNLFEQAPPGIFSVRNGLNYDRIGRAFKTGVRVSY